MMDRTRLKSIPKEPGVYQFLDKDGNIIYIGKAKNLKRRVSSYFNKKHEGKTATLVTHIVDVHTIITHTEVEALLLENRLINEHKPRFNIALRDSKRYAWIVVTDEPYPRIRTARSKKVRGKYFGPYTDGFSRRKTILTLNRLFQLRTCQQLPKRVCLQYHIKHCTGPCASHDTKEAYNARIKQAIRVLEGKTKGVIDTLKEQMMQAATDQRFEEAIRLRDGINALTRTAEVQISEQLRNYDQDVIAYDIVDNAYLFVVLQVKRGVIAQKREYTIPDQEDVIEGFVKALYSEGVPPKEILVSGLSDGQRTVLEAYFSKRIGSVVHITAPQRGAKKRLLDLAQKNVTIAKETGNPALVQLQKHLKLAEPPQTIDCFDISTIQGAFTVAASVRYVNGKPDPSMYRRFEIRSVVHDDFGAMEEAVKRRYKTAEDLPDLIVIDGGKGQLGAAVKALRHVTTGQPVISLAKKDEEVFVPGLSIPIPIPQTDAGLLLLRRIRDATHRFVIRYHRLKRGRAMTSSMLDHYPGIGAKRKEALYKQFASFDRMKKASKEELQRVIGEKLGAQLYETLQKEK